MKRLICLLIAAVLLLAGCGSSTEATKEIVVWNAGIMTEDPAGVVPDEEMPMQKAIDQFEEDNPEYYVTVVNYDAESLNQALTAANQAGEGPDVVAMWAGAQTMVFKDYLLPLDEYLTEEEKAIYDTSAMTHLNFDPEQPMMAFPGNGSTTGVFYNVELLEASGIDPDSIVTWDDFMEANKTLTENGSTGTCVGDADGYTTTWAAGEFLIDQVGPEGLSALYNGEASINSPEMALAIETWSELFAAGYTNPDWRSTTDGDAIKQFTAGSCGFMIQGSWAISQFADMGSNIGVIKFPSISEDAPYGDYVMSQPIINVGVTAYTEYPEASVELAKAFSSPEFLDEQLAIENSNEDLAALNQEMASWSEEGKTAMGFDSAIDIEAATEFYKLAPMAVSGEMPVEEYLATVAALDK